MSKQTKLQQLADTIVSDNACPDLAKQATQLVFGDGNPDADIVFVGEAPGKNEDQQGKPFVGAAGKFLNQMLEMIGLKREKVYITNIVKYRPPNNRDPLPEEKAVFLPYLENQLGIIRPKLIVTLGRHSMNSLLPGLRISEAHGQPKRVIWGSFHKRPDDLGADATQGADEQRTESYQEYIEGVAESATPQSAASISGVTSFDREQTDATVVILPLFHPAAALYNSSLKQTLIDDFAKIPAILAKLI